MNTAAPEHGENGAIKKKYLTPNFPIPSEGISYEVFPPNLSISFY
jgi:hypothetical protein